MSDRTFPRLPFDAADVRKFLGLLERLATAQERTAAALEEANTLDPMRVLDEVLAAGEGEKPDVNRTGIGADDPNAWRFR